jgi:hypothetical protein
MTMHLVGYELSASNAALTALTPIPDGTVAISGNDIRVPSGLTQVCWAAAMINSAAATLRAQLQSPLLRSILNFDISPINNGLVFGSLPRINHLWRSPLQLAALEPLDFMTQNGGAVMNRGFVSLCDGPINPVSGKIYTIRATAAATLVTASWVNGALTFGQTLPSGHYQCVGFRSWSANQCAARLFFVGGSWRPGVPALNTEDNNEWFFFRHGNSGVWGEFDNTTPPSVDFMGITDTAEVCFLDLIKVS